jgi:hypothetical protein
MKIQDSGGACDICMLHLCFMLYATKSLCYFELCLNFLLRLYPLNFNG